MHITLISINGKSLKKVLSSKLLSIIILFLISAIAFTAVVTKPFTFNSGQTISAAMMNQNFDTIYDAVNNLIPVGTILAWHKNWNGSIQTLPEGWEECNGTIVSTSGSPVFGWTKPNLNGASETGHFLRGSSASGNFQLASAVRDHTSYFPGGGTNVINYDNENIEYQWSSYYEGYSYGSTEVGYYRNIRPINMSIVWIIKVK